MTTQQRELTALVAPAARLPAVQTFLADLRAKVATINAVFSDLMRGSRAAARLVIRRSIVLAPQWWQHAGRLGVPDCGAVWESSDQLLSEAGK